MTDRKNLTVGDLPVAVLAGGMATRLYPITKRIPKSMVAVAGRPFVAHQLELLARKGVRRVVFCLGNLGEQVAEFVGDGRDFGISVDYSFDGEKLLGTGGALRTALPKLGEVFWVLYGDSYLDVDFRAILGGFKASDALGLMTVLRNENKWDTSNVRFESGKLAKYSKTDRDESMKYIDYGLSVMTRAAAERIPADRATDLSELYTGMVERGEMAGWEVGKRFYEIGSPRGLAETEEYLSARAA